MMGQPPEATADTQPADPPPADPQPADPPPADPADPPPADTAPPPAAADTDLADPPGDAAGPPPLAEPIPAPPPMPRHRTGLWASFAVVVVLLLCGGGVASAYLLLRNAENGTGSTDPTTAVGQFMKAIYIDKDTTDASKLVCSEARDAKKLAAKVDEIKGYAQQYDEPTFTWDEPLVEQQTDKRALVSVALTMVTADDKMAKQELTFTVVRKSGWWVCEVAG